MQLANGARISGTVTASDTSAPLEGVRILARDLAAGTPAIFGRTRADGSYTLNVPAGLALYLLADNHTLQPYAGGTYNGPSAGGATGVNGAVMLDQGTVLAPAAGSTITANFALLPGRKVDGIVTVGPTASDTPVPGISVRIYESTGGFVTALRSNLAGRYRIWLQPNASAATPYAVRVRGQVLSADLSSSSVVDNFVQVVNSRTLTLTSDGTTPVSQVKAMVYDSTTAATNPNTAYEGFEITNGDGSVTVYTTSSTATNKKVVFMVDGPQAGVGSSAYLNAISLGGATNLLFDNTSLGTLTLPAGVELGGTVTVSTVGFPPAPGNYAIQVRGGGTALANFFVNTRTQGDGSYSIRLPVGSFNVRACQAGTATCSAWSPVTIAPPTAPSALNFTM
jgi:hypothetical protein